MRAAASASAWSLDGAGMGGAVVMRCFCCFFSMQVGGGDENDSVP